MGTSSSKPEDPLSAQLHADSDLKRENYPDPSSETIRLPPDRSDPTCPARTLSYAIYGCQDAPPGRTILFFHGTPGTRFFFSRDHATFATTQNVRILLPERPGYGCSTPFPERTLSSTVGDYIHLLDSLQIRSVFVVGYSAGGPFALAFARWYASRCASVAIISSLSPNRTGVTSGMTFLSRLGYWLCTYMPGVLKWLVRSNVEQDLANVFEPKRSDFDQIENEQFSKDYEIRRLFIRSTLELYARRCGAEAEAEDYILMAGEWGFDLSDISDEIALFVYGARLDNKCTKAMFRILVNELPEKRLMKVEESNANHLYFYSTFEERLFQDLGLLET